MHQTRPLLLKVIFLLLTSLIMISNFAVLDQGTWGAAAEDGRLDLSRYDFDQKGILCLDGAWQFYFQRFLEPVSYLDLQPEDTPDVYITPPTTWNYYEVAGKPIPGFGYGTYRMILTGVKPGIPMAIKMLPQSTAFRLYINHVLMAENGKVAQNPEDSAVAYHPDTIHFTPHTTELVITIHISNYVYARGGIWDAPTLGTREQIESLDRFVLHRDLFLQGCYCIAFLLFFVIYINNPNKRALLYFAALSAVTAARVMIYGGHLIAEHTENFRLITFIEYSTRLWFPILLLLLLNEELCGKLPKRLLSGLAVLILGLTAAVAVLPISVFTAYAKVLIAYDFIMGVCMLFIMLWPGERFFPKSTNKSKVFFFYGNAAICICGIYDMFFASTAYVEMIPIGFFAALLAFAFILAITYADALSDCEDALRKLEIESERKLQTELKLLQSQIRPHFLYNALSAIANVCGKDGKKAEQLILDLAYFMQASFDFRSYEKLTTLENELEYIRKYVHIEKARFGEKIKYTEEIEVLPSTQLPRLIIEPLVENAIRHGISKKKCGGEVILRITNAQEGILVEVNDNGVGISREKMSEILDGESRGIGLKNIQDRLIRSGSTGLTIDSTPQEYTRIRFVIRREK